MTSHSMNLHKVHKTPQPPPSKNMLSEYPLLRFAKGGEGEGEKGKKPCKKRKSIHQPSLISLVVKEVTKMTTFFNSSLWKTLCFSL